MGSTGSHLAASPHLTASAAAAGVFGTRKHDWWQLDKLIACVIRGRFGLLVQYCWQRGRAECWAYTTRAAAGMGQANLLHSAGE